MKTIRFGIIGCGLMGREFASAVLRWRHLHDWRYAVPEIVGICDPNEAARAWFNDLGIKYSVSDYRELLEKKDIDAIYCSVPHHLHARLYCDIIQAGKHLMGEKPFGIDQTANREILNALKQNPDVFARCSSEFPFFPGCRELIRWIREGRLGTILEVRAEFCHSSDMDVTKPINWKRRKETNGEYGCIGDLGIHVQHIPLRMGFVPKSVYATLTNAVPERPDGKGDMVPCDTWDNATLLCEVDNPSSGNFTMLLETKRMEPGATNRWSLVVYGMDASVRFTTDDPNAFYYTNSWGKEQAWCRIGIGYKPQFPTITGPIFEFGFPDAILQMWAAFIAELEGGTVEFGCLTSAETAIYHQIATAALLSHAEKRAVLI